MKIYELKPTNGRKSFYGKALVKETENEIIYNRMKRTFARLTKTAIS